MDIPRTDLTTRVLEKALNGLSTRAAAISNNVANVDTPNFKTSEVVFEQDLQSALRRGSNPNDLQMAVTDQGHLRGFAPPSVDGVQARAIPMLNTTMRNDGNNVDIEREMARLAETQLSFQATTQMLNLKYQQLRQAIWEGKR